MGTRNTLMYLFPSLKFSSGRVGPGARNSFLRLDVSRMQGSGVEHCDRAARMLSGVLTAAPKPRSRLQSFMNECSSSQCLY